MGRIDREFAGEGSTDVGGWPAPNQRAIAEQVRPGLAGGDLPDCSHGAGAEFTPELVLKEDEILAGRGSDEGDLAHGTYKEIEPLEPPAECRRVPDKGILECCERRLSCLTPIGSMTEFRKLEECQGG